MTLGHIDPRVLSAVERCIGKGAVQPGNVMISVLLPPGGGQVTVIVARDVRPAVVGSALAKAFPAAMLDAQWWAAGVRAGPPALKENSGHVARDARPSVAELPTTSVGPDVGGEGVKGRASDAGRGGDGPSRPCYESALAIPSPAARRLGPLAAPPPAAGSRSETVS